MMMEGDSSDEETLLQQEEKRGKLKENWDLFEVLPPDKDDDLDEDRTVYNFILRTMKGLTYLAVFAVVLGAAVVSKSTTILMTSQLRKDLATPYCYKKYGTNANIQFIAYFDVTERISWVWAIYFAFILPEVQTFLRSLRILVFKGQERPTALQFFIPFIFETLHTAGLALLVFNVLPWLDAPMAAMLTNGMCIVPGILNMLSRNYDAYWILKNLIDVVMILFQLSALFVWPLFAPQKSTDSPWLLSVSVLLVSFGWWENFVEVSSPFPIIQKLGKMKKRLRRTRYFAYLILSVWKMAVFLGMLVVSVKINENQESWLAPFDLFKESFQTHEFIVVETRPPINPNMEVAKNSSFLQPGAQKIENYSSTILWTMGTQMVSTYLCYIFGKLACRICIQSFSFSFPVLLAVPATITVMISLCGFRNGSVCFWDSIFPGYIWWNCPGGDFWEDYFLSQHLWVWVLWLLSQAWITLHIWSPKGHRLAKTETVFATPMYNAFLMDQSLAMNRRRDEDEVEFAADDGDDSEEDDDDYFDPEIPHMDSGTTESIVKPEDWVPKIYACATMWHEIPEEMIEMLKSIFRMDFDQCARRIAKKHLAIDDPDYYEFETNIFFDDAFELSDKTDANSPVQINSFVRDFIDQMEEAAAHVHQQFIKLRSPKKIPTPYGGRLEWILPGRTKLICHIKDKNKIRHKKRWSQVMYMYYLLGHKLTDSDIELERKEVIAANTYLLALDGDIDFQPKAVELLVDLMKKNRNLGAACGRIHPIGSGPMVWYQRFEYAVGHWFQKATEHVFGCVLCSPGCFSLFRAKALMDYNVMKRYTTMATEPRHYVQYDQGEDRWLCTLLLQRGWRVEYCAASDSKTHAPEGFREFYNQRRRWVPSTMANIMDLLLDGSKTVQLNPDISYPYIMYQTFLMVGTILGPGTIFLMLVGAFAVAFKLSQWTSFMYNLIPLLLFILVCFLCKSNIQLAVAEILTTIYALAMVAVVVAIILQITDDGLLAPSTLFLFVVASTFIIAGIIHPLEFWCLPHGFLYYISIPSMYLLLIIYSLFNLNIVSWGTREGQKTKTKQELEAEKKEQEEAQAEAEAKKKKGMLGGLIPGIGGFGGADGKSDGSFEISFAGLFKLMCCVSEKPDAKKEKLDTIALTIAGISKRIETIEKSMEKQFSVTKKLSLVAASPGIVQETILEEELANFQGRASVAGQGVDQSDNEDVKESIKRDDLMNPCWLEDEHLKGFKVDFLTGREITFWIKMVQKYLRPLDADKKKEKEIGDQLIDLRNKVAFTFIMCNAVFVILVFLLQLEKSSVHINWPLNVQHNVTYLPMATEIEVSFEYLELEPIGLVFVMVFGLVLGTQFIGMCVHRTGTFFHIMALTYLDIFGRDSNSANDEQKLIKEGIGLIKQLQKANIKEAKKAHEKEKAQRRQTQFPGKRKTVAYLLEGSRNVDKPVHDLARNFHQIMEEPELFHRTTKSKAFQSEKGKRTFQTLAERRSTVLGRKTSFMDQRKSQIFGEGPMVSGRPRNDSITTVASSTEPLPAPIPARFGFKNSLAGQSGFRKSSNVSGASRPDEFEMNSFAGQGRFRKPSNISRTSRPDDFETRDSKNWWRNGEPRF